MRIWDRRRDEVCESCGRMFKASGPQRVCLSCRAILHKEMKEVSDTRHKAPTRFCLNCGKPLHPGNAGPYCSYLCEMVYLAVEEML